MADAASVDIVRKLITFSHWRIPLGVGCRRNLTVQAADLRWSEGRRDVMGWNPLFATGSPDAVGIDSIETLIVPRSVDVNPFIRRVLPAPQRQMVGPFIFFDQFGPLEVIASSAGDVRPHPHIGLATVTYIYRGEVHHRDSLGTSQIIAPGAVNWMVAGRGITHSERAPAQLLGHSVAYYGIQTWVALPEREEDATPRFEHHPREALPVLEDEGINLRLILGNAYGAAATLPLAA